MTTDRTIKLQEAKQLCIDGATIARRLLSLSSELMLDDELANQVTLIQGFSASQKMIEKEATPPFTAGFTSSIELPGYLDT